MHGNRWASSALGSSTADIASVLWREELDSEAISLSSVEQLHAVGIPLGLALKLKRCFGETTASYFGNSADAGWRDLKVTASAPLIIRNSTEYPHTTAITVTDGGTIHLGAETTLTILGSFNAPLQHIFIGDGKVVLRGDQNGQVYPQWWGAIAYSGSPSELVGGMVDADAAIQSAVWAAQLPVPDSGTSTLDFGGSHLPAVVFLPPGVYSVGAPIELPDHASLLGAGPGSTHLIANANKKPAAMIAPPAYGVNRTDGWRLRGFSLQGLGKDIGGSGLYLIQTSRAVVSDVDIADFTYGLHLNGEF